jgi:hypothetical protein
MKIEIELEMDMTNLLEQSGRCTDLADGQSDFELCSRACRNPGICQKKKKFDRFVQKHLHFFLLNVFISLTKYTFQHNNKI